MIKAINTLLIILTIVSVNAQENKIPDFLLSNEIIKPENKILNLPSEIECSRRYKYHNFDEIQSSAIIRRNYNVLTYDLYMDWYNVLNSTGMSMKERTYTGKNTIGIEIDSPNVSFIEFDAASLQIDSVFVDNVEIKPTPQPINDTLIIPLERVYNQNETLNVRIDYTHNLTYNSGFFLYPKGRAVDIGPPPARDTIYIEERIAYTMSEPEGARYWMPCNDAPYDKAISNISVRVPKGYTVASNGRRKSIEKDDSSKTYNWGDNVPITTYLMCATASKFKEFSDWYIKRNEPNDSVEIKYYVWESDYKNTVDSVYNPDTTDVYKFNARHAFDNVVAMVENFADKWIEYPFVKYGMAAVQDFGFGGMEHQTMTTIHRNWLRDFTKWGYNGYWGNQIGIAHELAHMWLGDLITCATWKDIWINEGGASWGEAIFFENIFGGYNSYLSRMMSHRYSYMGNGGLALHRIYAPPMELLFSGPISYSKGAWVYHMLRTMLGDSVFFPAFRNLLTKHAYTSIETEDFKNSFKEEVPNPPVPFDTYFDQWVYHAGHPVYELSTVSNNWGAGGYNVTVNLNQIQPETDSIPAVFVAPVFLKFFGPDTVVNDTVINNKRSQSFNFRLGFQIDSVSIDSNLVLCELSSSIVSVRENKDEKIGTLNIFPNPITKGQNGKFTMNIINSQNINIDIIDNLGRHIQNIYTGSLQDGNYTFEFNTRELVPGSYMILCRTGDKCRTFRFAVL
ncbi:MAG: T9SS type A sorting domain-containing protein [Bacteroidetes bacterium]|nr:MAG: T9SS type A sorting domain-containing protein [Bacteroidota bacterium]